jgi:hypothetical protein
MKYVPASEAAAMPSLGNGTERYILIGNTFPLSLVRRCVTIEPLPVEVLRAALAGRKIRSFWGHDGTLPSASRFVGTDLTPAIPRPAVTCDSATQLPSLGGMAFHECWVVSPEYAGGCRPAVGEEMSAEKIAGWRVLRLTWE